MGTLRKRKNHCIKRADILSKFKDPKNPWVAATWGGLGAGSVGLVASLLASGKPKHVVLATIISALAGAGIGAAIPYIWGYNNSPNNISTPAGTGSTSSAGSPPPVGSPNTHPGSYTSSPNNISTPAGTGSTSSAGSPPPVGSPNTHPGSYTSSPVASEKRPEELTLEELQKELDKELEKAKRWLPEWYIEGLRKRVDSWSSESLWQKIFPFDLSKLKPK